MRGGWTALGLALLAGCQSSSGAVALPAGPKAVIGQITSASGTSTVGIGERVRFAVMGSGGGTHFSGATYLNSPAFSDLEIVAVVNSSLLFAQGTISVQSAAGARDLAVVTGKEVTIIPAAFTIPSTVTIPNEGVPPVSVAGSILRAGAVALYQVAPVDDGLRTLIFRVDRDPAAPGEFEPTLEVYQAVGPLLAAPIKPCAAVQVNSTNPLVARIADPARGAGADHKYLLSVFYGDPYDCVLSQPGVPGP